MNPLLLVLNPRRIPECIEAIEGLDIDKAWLTGYTEPELERAIPELLDTVDHDTVLVLSDDTIPTQAALDAVLDLHAPGQVTTGYCNLDVNSPFVNLTRKPFTTRHSTAEAYDFYTHVEIAETAGGRHAFRSWFTGMCLTCMDRDLWDRFPFQTYEGRSSDFALSLRLQDADIPILAPPDGMVWHVKEKWNQRDQAHGKRLLIGEVPAETRLDLRVPA